jgi:hypothetical protein
MKNIIKMISLSTNVQQIVALIMNEKKGGGEKTSFKDISDKLKYPQLFLKGSKEHFLIIMDKSGVKSYSAILKSGNKLSAVADKLKNNTSAEQRIDDNGDYVIVPCKNDEEVTLNLDFNGSGGILYRVTKDKIDKIEYPKSSSGKITVASGNSLTFGKENKGKETKESKTSLFSGSWETAEFGSVSFVITGSTVIGTCSKNLGGMKGTLSSDGTKITGEWARFPTYSSPNDAGKFEITVSADGKSFSGKWCKGTDAKIKPDKTLNGKKK